MKKLLLATAVAALSVTAAQAAPTVYGKAFLTLDAVKDNNDATKERTQLNSNASRIGFKGSEALTKNVDVLYQLEYGVNVDAANDRTFTQRDTYLGLAHKQYGTLLAGRLTAIDAYVDYANVTQGGVLGGDNVLAAVDAPRANNTFAYVSPSYNGLSALAMYTLDENPTNNPSVTESFAGDVYGVAVRYEPAKQPFQVGASYIVANQAAAGQPVKAARVSGAYALSNNTTVAALYQHTDLSTNADEHAVTLSANHTLAAKPQVNVYGQVDLVDNAGAIKDAERQRLVLGAKHAINQNATGHLYGAYLRDEVAGVKANSYGIGGGLEYRF